MKKMLCKGLSLAIALAMCLAMATTALADVVTYTPIAGPGSVTLYDYLVAEQNATVLSYDFTFTLAAGTAATNVNAGPTVTDGEGNVTAPSVASVTISSADKLDTLSADDEAALGDQYDSAAGDAVFRKTITLDFSGVTFNEPGVYRYVLTQEAGTTPGVNYDTNAIRYVDVYVQNKITNGALDEGQLAIQGTVVHTDGANAGFVFNADAAQSMPNIGAKNEAYVNTLDTVDLTLQKLIEGNQADLNATFNFTIEVELPAGAADGTFTITPLTTDGTVTGNGTFTTTSGIGTGAVTLGKGGKIAIYGLPHGTKVTISEENGQYAASYVVGAGASQEGNETTELTLNADTSVVFTNTLEGTIPTGVLLTIAPFAALMIIGLVGVLVMMKKRSGK